LNETINILLLTCLLVAPAGLKALDTELPSADDLSRLRSGDVITEAIRTDESGGAARFQIYMQAPVEDIWNVIFSCDQGFIFVKGLRKCVVLENDGLTTLTRQVVKSSWLVPAQDFTFRTDREPFSRVEFMRTEGSPREMEGSWEFNDLGNGVLVTHEIRVRPGFPVPRFLIRSVMKHTIPEMLACIRALANGSTSEAQQVTDSASCPGSPK
jgi:hypothetical protein